MFLIRFTSGEPGKGKKMTQKGLWLDLGYKLVKYDQVSVIGYDCEKSCFRFYIERKGSRQKEAFLIVRKYDFRCSDLDRQHLADGLNNVLRMIILALIRMEHEQGQIADLPEMCSEMIRCLESSRPGLKCRAV